VHAPRVGLIAMTVLLALPAASRAGTIREQTPLLIPANTRQLIVVSSPTNDPAPPGYLATLRAYERAGPAGGWRPALGPWPAETGFGHLRAVRREGDGATPVGVWPIGRTMYGTEPRPQRLRYAYHRLGCGDWWDEDPYSPDYNRFEHVPCGTTPAFAAHSEALWTETTAYRYFLVIDFNINPIVRGAQAPGSGIFLHSWVGGATAGCVALPPNRLLTLMRWLMPASHPVIAIATTDELRQSGLG
jgi:L,D-peptidoglycan transpeptidase YkuD (ErfK/YbiS/YcfS/YnhG family)